MKFILFPGIVLVCILVFNCTKAPAASSLKPVDFSEKINKVSGSIIVDVRSPEEYSEGHLTNAKNIDWNGDDFEARINQLDKSKPVFVYCQGGGRSASAAKQMRSLGFNEVYELEGGLSDWEKENLPVTKN